MIHIFTICSILQDFPDESLVIVFAANGLFLLGVVYFQSLPCHGVPYVTPEFFCQIKDLKLDVFNWPGVSVVDDFNV